MPPGGATCLPTGITGKVKNQVLSPHLPFLLPWYTQHSELGSPVSKMAEPKSEMGPSPWITVWMRDINHAHYFDYVVRLKKKIVILSCDTFFGSVYEAGSVTVIITLSDQETFFFSHLFYQVVRVCVPGGPSGKESTCQCRICKRHWFSPWVGKISWRRKWHLTPVFLPGESHGQRSMAGYSPWDCKDLDMTEQRTESAGTMLFSLKYSSDDITAA